MNQYSVNLSTIFTEVPFLERFKKAKEAGFLFAECQFPYTFSMEDIQQKLEDNQVALALINLPPGNWEQGERGLAVLPDKIQEFKDSVEEGIRYATALKVPNIHCMAGILSEEADKKEAREIYLENLTYAASLMAKQNLSLLIEPINSFDMPGYFLSDIEEANSILSEVNMPNVKLQFDFYHIERIHGNLLANFKRYKDVIGHVQIADSPGRHQPGTGSIDYQRVFEFLKEVEYKGLIGLEYTPKGNSENSFEWLT
ncbi:hydroxypyruvate isomerase [Bacillus sp. M6-12]|uniref:hydroxypyruvate isomerase family protein n=1 Tax=Bacillus sp. M6-12 TaxID=2054166 RepID=UPI000C7761DE|nr:TIM barrel protein [Bacillus sp. M6-12]PLS16169.1 hydroxypyruvate isomerase [Bacillus sp. M6-12]